MSESKLHRSRTNQIIAGVCGGIAETYDIDPTLVRIIFIILAFWAGLGIILYILGIILLPYPDEPNKIDSKEIGKRIEEAANDFKENISKHKDRPTRGNEIVGVIIILLGLILLLRNFIPWISMHLFWPIILILLGVLVLAGTRKGQK